MQEIINSKIKKRESFRPFAPSVLEEDVGKFFECDIRSEFMNHIVEFKKEWQEIFPSVCHVDNTARLQTVNKDNNPLFYKLIFELKKITGYGVILNTSFNENEPIVDTPDQAIDCFLRTDMDVLFLEKFMIESKSTFFPKFHELIPSSFGMMLSAFLNSVSGLNKSG